MSSSRVVRETPGKPTSRQASSRPRIWPTTAISYPAGYSFDPVQQRRIGPFLFLVARRKNNRRARPLSQFRLLAFLDVPIALRLFEGRILNGLGDFVAHGFLRVSQPPSARCPGRRLP